MQYMVYMVDMVYMVYMVYNCVYYCMCIYIPAVQHRRPRVYRYRRIRYKYKNQVRYK
jgi:hypothetical protein